MKIKNIDIFGGGTIEHITNHFAVTAPAYGNTARQINEIIKSDSRFSNFNVNLHLTKMAGGSKLETNQDIAEQVELIKKDFNSKIVFFNCALVDWKPASINLMVEDKYGTSYNTANTHREFGKYNSRLDTHTINAVDVRLEKSNKIIPNIRKGRKDIFLVGFKTTCGASKQEMYEKGLKLCKDGSVNLVLVNDTKTRWNIIITPEESAYHETDNRLDVLKNLVDMVWYRSQLTFTQSTVVDGKPVSWNDPRIPTSLREAVNHCIKGNAYKPFQSATVGHFGIKISDNEFLTSIRKSDLNKLSENGLVYVKTDGPDSVIAYGAKPSVGGQSQRIIFNDHQGYDCIVHFHSPMKENHTHDIPIVSQRSVECGSHQCGSQTSGGLKQFGNLKAVFLDQHGPNIVFPKNINPKEVIDFIDANFDLSKKTGGYNL